MVSVLLGLVTVLFGSWGLFHWWGGVTGILKGLLPFSFICGGLIAILAGSSSFRK